MAQRRVLAAVDGSVWTDRITDYIMAVFPREDTEIVILHVASPLPDVLWDFQQNPLSRYRMKEVRAYLEAYKSGIEKKLQEVREKLIRHGFAQDMITVKTEVRQVGIARDIIYEAQKGYDVLVVGRRGESKLKNLVLGSVATKALGKLSMLPVAIVGDGPTTGNILIALDGSPESTNIVHCVGKIFQNSKQRFFIIHIFRGVKQAMVPPIMDAPYSTLPPQWFDWVEQERETALHRIEQVLDDTVSILASYGITAEKDIILDVPSRAEEIVNQARKRGCGTVVVGRRGISRVEEFLLGRVSNKVLQLAHERTVWIVSC